jgi:zinc transport system ATP-binding protein
MDNRAKIAFIDVRFCYGEVCAINRINFSLKQKTLVALIGPNGGGKSTIIKLMTGLIKSEKGEILKEEDVRVGYVPQKMGFDTMFPITVKELVLMGTLCEKITPFYHYNDNQKQKAVDAIKRVGLDSYQNRGIDQLSGGQLKRAIIARVLASDANIIVLDEPDESLDIDAVRELYAILEQLKQDKIIVVASHHVEAILDVADEAIYVNKEAKTYDDPQILKEKLKRGIQL